MPTDAEYADGFTIMNRLVVGLKLLGAVVACCRSRTVRDGRRRGCSCDGVGAFATLGLYALGGVTQAIGMATGVTGGRDEIDVAGVLYVSFSVSAAIGYGVLAVSYSRRHRVGGTAAVVGVSGAPVMLLLLLVAVPALLAALGVMPAPR
jgi:hypothetical protein